MAKQRRTDERKAAFLDAVGRGYDTSAAVKKAGVARATPYEWATSDEPFASAWREAERVVLDNVRAVAYDLALHGNERLLVWFLNRQERAEAAEDGVDDRDRGFEVVVVGLEDEGDASGAFFRWDEAPPAP